MQEMPLLGGFGCHELVLYGTRELVYEHHDLNQSEHSVSMISTNDNTGILEAVFKSRNGS